MAYNGPGIVTSDNNGAAPSVVGNLYQVGPTKEQCAGNPKQPGCDGYSRGGKVRKYANGGDVNAGANVPVATQVGNYNPTGLSRAECEATGNKQLGCAGASLARGGKVPGSKQTSMRKR